MDTDLVAAARLVQETREQPLGPGADAPESAEKSEAAGQSLVGEHASAERDSGRHRTDAAARELSDHRRQLPVRGQSGDSQLVTIGPQVVADVGGYLHRQRRGHHDLEFDVADHGVAHDDVDVRAVGDGTRPDEGVVEATEGHVPPVWLGTHRILDSTVSGEQADPAVPVMRSGRGQRPVRRGQQVRSCRGHMDAYHLGLATVD